jgi:hypothetical protein
VVIIMIRRRSGGGDGITIVAASMLVKTTPVTSIKFWNLEFRILENIALSPSNLYREFICIEL